MSAIAGLVVPLRDGGAVEGDAAGLVGVEPEGEVGAERCWGPAGRCGGGDDRWGGEVVGVDGSDAHVVGGAVDQAGDGG